MPASVSTYERAAGHRPAALVAATAGLAPALRRRSCIGPIAQRRLVQTDSARCVPHHGGFLMDCPRCRLHVRVYYINSFFTTSTFDLLLVILHPESRQHMLSLCKHGNRCRRTPD